MQREVEVHQKHSIPLFFAGALIAAALLTLLTACSIPSPASTYTAPNQFSPIVQQSPVTSAGQKIEQTITRFCSAVHTRAYGQAYTYLSGGFKTTVTSPSRIPDALGQGRKLTNCADFGNGAFLKINGSQATDSVILTVLLVQLGSSSQGGGSMSFVETGSTWLIDGITG